MTSPIRLDSYFVAGFECSTHQRADGRRLDLLETTGHARHAAEDYELLVSLNIRSARDGLRWHLIERTPHQYDWTSFLPMLRAAETAGMQIIWDLCHYGWPDWLDIWSPAFIDHFSAFCAAAAEIIRIETSRPPVYCVINEISYWAWAGGEVAQMNPCVSRRGGDLKRQLVAAAIAGIEAIRHVDPRARFIQPEPLINVVSGTGDPRQQRAAEDYTLAQYEAFDMLLGRRDPELGGRFDHIDFVGVNFYPDNQWYLGGSIIPMGHHAYLPLRTMLRQVYRRYQKPLLIAETGAEGGARPYWLHYVGGEVAAAQADGVPVQAICLYPILDYHGWDNDRICNVGLLSLPNAAGRRTVDRPFLAELQRQQSQFPTEPWAGTEIFS